MSDARSGMLDAAIALGIRVLSAGLVFGLQVLLARLMPADGYGGFVTLWTWMLALGSFAALGFAESSVRFLPRYHLRGRVAALRNYWRFGLAMVFGASVALAIAAIAVAVGIGIADGPGLMLLLVALGLPFLAMEYFLEGVARSFGWFRLAALPVYIVRPILIGLICVGLSAAGIVLSLPIVGAVLIGSMALVTAGLALVLARRLRVVAPEGAAPTRRQRRLWLMASLPLLLLSGLEDLTGYGDVLVLSLLAEPEAVGIYFAAARSLALAGFVTYAMTLVAGRRFALDLAGKSRADLQDSILENTRMTLWATIAAVALALLAGPLLLGAFGEAFIAGYGVMVVLGAGMVVRAMAGQAGEAVIVLGRQREGLLVALGVLAIMTALALALVPLFGIVGAALASATAMTCRTLALALVLHRVEGLRILAFGLPRIRRKPLLSKPI
ncbi:lipopolysaccharide biosynthesis protein [Devosia sp. YIM 151766]|uniref:lipopolysaccharide biosynthesis protein n=1 Tax=Devosia sp. YIM 151766 TaxID=3017325 RepID=UPI00255CDEFA|nr:lipopolysaccharide biosynthesis protein [Devosia sp. YIM 151766]WIY51826.1 lipopolysaccharide biosynthesis protein [Devosia sp. YIM 151766]